MSLVWEMVAAEARAAGVGVTEAGAWVAVAWAAVGWEEAATGLAHQAGVATAKGQQVVVARAVGQ